jgi:hypothetical protein
MDAALHPLEGHAIVLILLQLSVLLTVPRLGSELVEGLGLPALKGPERAAGFARPPDLAHGGSRRLVFPVRALA